MTISAQEKLQQEENDRLIREKLVELSGESRRVDQPVTFHEDTSNKQIVLPAGMRAATGANILSEAAEAEAQIYTEPHTFDISPGDGAYCFQIALKRVFGMAGIPKATPTFFGRIPPRKITVSTGKFSTIRVPWGRVSVPVLEGDIVLGSIDHETLGTVFHVEVEIPQRRADELQGLFKMVEYVIQEESFYLGKAFAGVGNDAGEHRRRFLEPEKTDTNKIVYSDEVSDLLNYGVWGYIRNLRQLEDAGLKVNRKTLLVGKPGTGKTLAGTWTAQICQEHGVTFMQCNLGEDDIMQVMEWAKIYTRGGRAALIFMEDIDALLKPESGNKRTQMVQMMNLFDGLDAKENRVQMLMTSNHVELFESPFLRRGRFDSIINVGALDKHGVEKLLHALFKPEQLDSDLNFNEIYEAMDGYEPSFIRSTFDDVYANSIIRTGREDAVLATHDFVVAAQAARPQWELFTIKDAEPPKDPSIEAAIQAVRDWFSASLTAHAVQAGHGNQLDIVVK